MDRMMCVLVVLVVGLVYGQEEQLDREGKALVLKKVRRLRGQDELGQCPQTEGVQVYADPASCNRFYKCEDGKASAEACANGLLFDENMALTDAIHNYCVYSWKAECGERAVDTTPQSSPGCEYQ